MPQQKDVTISFGLDAEDITAAALKLRSTIEEIFKATEGKNTTAAFDQFADNLRSVYFDTDKMLGRLMELENTKILPKEYGEVTAQIKGLETELNTAIDTYTKLNQQINSLNKQLNERPNYKNTEYYRELSDTVMNRLLPAYEAEAQKLQDLQRQLQNAETQAKKFQAISQYTGNTTAFDKWSNRAAELKKQIDIVSGNMDSLNRYAESYAETMQALYTKDKVFIDRRKSVIDELKADYDSAKTKADDLQKTINELSAKLGEMEKNAPTGANTKEYIDILDKLERKISRTFINIRRFEQTGPPQEGITGWKVLINTINQGPKAAFQFADTIAATLPPAFQVAYAAARKLTDLVIGALKESFDLVTGTIKRGFIKAVTTAAISVKQLAKALLQLTGNVMLGPLKRLADSIKNIKKQADSSIPSIKQMGRAFIQYGLGARSLYFFVRKLRTALFEGFGDLAVAYEPFNAAMSQLMASLSYLRNSFVAAFAPIIQYVSPALSLLINKLAAAVQMLGQFIAALTGKEFVMAMPVYQDYASTTKAGAAAAKEAATAEKEAAKQEKNRAKALKEIARTIAGFDDVEILKEPKNTDSGTSGASSPSGSGGGGGGGLTFKTAPVAEGLQKFADMIKKAWLQADFYDLGVLMAKQLGNLLRAFHENVPKIEAFLNKVAKSIATFLAGFLSVNDTFKVLGVAVADVINLIFSAINTFLSTFMALDGFKNLGKDIYYAIVNALANIDWSTIYTVFATLGAGIAQTLNEVLTKPDLWELIFETLCNSLRAIVLRFYFFAAKLKWGDIGTAIGSGLIKGIETFPFQAIAQSAATFITGIFTALGNMARKVESEGGWYKLGAKIGGAIMTFFNGVFTKENGQSLGVFVNGIFTTLDGIIATTDFDQLAQDIIDFIAGFFSEFDWQEHADSILHVINTLLSKFLEFTRSEEWEKIVGEIWQYISTSPEVKQFLENIWGTIQTIAKAKLLLAMSKFLALGGMIALGILKGIVFGPAMLGQFLLDNVFTPIWNKIKSIFGISSPAKKMEPLGKNIGAGLLEGVKEKFKGVDKWIKDNIFTPFKSGLDTAFGIAGGVASKIKSIGNAVVSGFKKGADEKKSELNTETKSINTDTQKNLSAGDWKGIGSKAINSMKSGIDGAKDGVHRVAQNINQSMFKALESGQWRTIGTKALSAIQDGMNTIKPYLMQTAHNIQNSLYNAFTSAVNWFNVGDNIIEGIWRGIRGGWNWLYNKVWNLAVDLYNAACRALGIHSPSKVFAEKVGEMIPAGIGVGITDNESSATKPIEDLSDNLVDTAKQIKIPPIAMGEVIPTNTATQEDTTITLNSLLDVLQSLESDMVKRDELEEIITNIVRTYMNIDFHIGDEKLARHVNRGNSLLDRRYNPVAT